MDDTTADTLQIKFWLKNYVAYGFFTVDPYQDHTPNQNWAQTHGDHTSEEHPHYVASTAFATNVLGDGNKQSCLVIGPPLSEAIALQALNWEITYLDCREPPRLFSHHILADATKIPTQDNSFDAISCTCVLCHAGLGRYGDIIMQDADDKILQEIFRILKAR